jgi:16S rRNA (guanine1207-N2)-methyltransferase
LARSVAEQLPQTAVTCVYHDLYLAELARQALGGAGPRNLTIACRADLVERAEFVEKRGTEAGSESSATKSSTEISTFGAADHSDEPEIAALPLTSQGDGELVREQLQQAYAALPCGSLLLAATDNPRDTWLAEQLTALGGRPKRIDADEGAVYAVVRHDGPIRMRNFEGRFAFRDAGRLFDVISRGGVFSHRRMDPGARRLIDTMAIHDGDRVLDIGCGWGPVALAAAARGPNVRVDAIDSNARAVACTRLNAEHNGLAERVVARLEAFGKTDGPGTFDVAIGNPPYYADFRIAELFIRSAAEALRPGGRLLMVTKMPERYFEALEADFGGITAEEIKGYVVFGAERR